MTAITLDQLPWSSIALELVGADHGLLRQVDIHVSPSFSTEWLSEAESERPA